MSLRERILVWFEAGNSGTSSQIAAAVGADPRRTRQALSRLHAAGMLEDVQEVKEEGDPAGGRPMKVWVLVEGRPAPRPGVKATPEQAQELRSAAGGATAGELMLAWLGDGNTGTVHEMSAAVGVTHVAAASAIRRLRELDLAEVVGTKQNDGRGRPMQVYAWTGAMPPLPADDEEDDRRPLNRTPAEVLVRSAIRSQPALATIWGAASFTTQGTTA